MTFRPLRMCVSRAAANKVRTSINSVTDQRLKLIKRGGRYARANVNIFLVIESTAESQSTYSWQDN